MNAITLRTTKSEVRVDSRIVAEQLGNQHEAIFKLILTYQKDFEEFGVVRFEIGKPSKGSKGGRPERYALLNENQSYLLLTYAKNTARARRLKINLVKAFAQYRNEHRADAEYLPFYHSLHDEVQLLSEQAHEAGSNTPERIFHININRLINKAFGLESGQRPDLPASTRARVTYANLVVREQIEAARKQGADHKEAYRLAKETLARCADIPVLIDRSGT